MNHLPNVVAKIKKYDLGNGVLALIYALVELGARVYAFAKGISLVFDMPAWVLILFTLVLVVVDIMIYRLAFLSSYISNAGKKSVLPWGFWLISVIVTLALYVLYTDVGLVLALAFIMPFILAKIIISLMLFKYLGDTYWSVED